MANIAVIYWSGTGNTEMMAEAVAKGIADAGHTAELFTAGDFSADMAGKYDKFAFGCPATGTEELEEDEFLPLYTALQNALSGKSVALFGSYSWGDGEWMRLWQADAAAAGLSLVQDGLAVPDTPDGEGLSACEALGKALANA